MKRIYIALIAVCSLAFFSCNDEWKDEQYIKMVSFTKNGVNDVYLKYDQAGGTKTYRLPVVISGSTGNDKDVYVKVALDMDTVSILNFENFKNRTDLYYKMLDPAMYEIQAADVHIPKGDNVGYLNIDFTLLNLDMIDKYILPIKITSTSEYIVNFRRYFKKSLMNIKLFNDFSGSWQAKTKVTYPGAGNEMEVPNRNAFVVNEKTIFFYAGNSEQDAKDRIKTRVFCEFNQNGPTAPDGSCSGDVRMYALEPSLGFTQQRGTYTVTTDVDVARPYIKRKYVTMDIRYEYTNNESPIYPIHMTYDGKMVLERSYNTLIPEDLQQEIF